MEGSRCILIYVVGKLQKSFWINKLILEKSNILYLHKELILEYVFFSLCLIGLGADVIISPY